MTLMPVSKILRLGLEVLELRRRACGSGGAPSPRHRPALVDRLAREVEHAAQRAVADRHGDRATRCRPRPGRATRPSVEAQRDRAHASAAEVLLHLERE